MKNPYIENIFTPDDKEKIKKEKFHYGILLTNSFSSAFSFLSFGIKERIGYPMDGRSLLLTRRVPLPENWRNIPQIDFYLKILDFLGMKIEKIKPKIYLDNKEKNDVIEKFSLPEKFFIIAPGASYGSSKRWDVENFGKLSSLLKNKVVIVGSKNEKKLGDIIKKINKNVINLVGKTSLREAIIITSLSSLVICNDSGILHISSAFNIPVVAIYGPTPVEKTKPWYGKVKVIKKNVECSPCRYRKCPYDHKCMKLIKVEEVLELAKDFS